MIKVWIFVILTIGMMTAGVFLLIRGKQKNCAGCGYPIRESWIFCPKCGQNVEMEESLKAVPKTEKRKLLQVCGMLICVPLFCYLLIGTILIPEVMNQQYATWLAYDMDSTDVDSQYLQDWFDDCDEKVDRVDCYILRQDIPLLQENVAEKSCSYIIYFDSGQALQYEKNEAKADKQQIYLKTADDLEDDASAVVDAGNVLMGVTEYYGNLEPEVWVDGERITAEVKELDEIEINLEELLEKETE